MPHLPEFFDQATHEGNLSRYAVPSLVVVHARSEADAVEAAQQALDDANVEGEAVGWSGGECVCAEINMRHCPVHGQDDDLEVACRQLLGAEYGSNAWAESWDNLEAVLGMRESDG